MTNPSRRVNPRLLQSEPMRRCELSECRGACCLHGAWVDQTEAEDIQAHAPTIQSHMPEGWRDPGGWFDGRREPDPHALSGEVLHTTVLSDPDHYGGSACIFLRPDHKCALQVAAEAEGQHPWRFKPFYCILHPLDLDEGGAITLDVNEALLEEPASCMRPSSESKPLLMTFEPELRYLLGENGYERLVKTTE